MSHPLPHPKNRWSFITARVFWILFLALFVLSLAVVVPQIAVGYGTQPGNFGPDGEFTMFAAWMFGLGPAGILSAITSLVSLCISQRKRFSAFMLATPFLAFGISVLLMSIAESGAK